jgi:hypothetical protein
MSKKFNNNYFVEIDKESASTQTKPTILLVLGMHRSGTSLTARLLECFGALNSKKTIHIQLDNPKGFFEDHDIYRFNETKLLPRLGNNWHSIGFVDWNKIIESELSELEVEAVNILKSNYSIENRLSILKEPRIGILLPFWLCAINKAGYDVKIVCSIRDPLSVARSLRARNGFSITHGGMLYITYWLSILSNIQDLPVAFIEFDEIIEDPARVLGAVSKQLAIGYPADFEERLRVFSSEFLDASLRHSKVDLENLQHEHALPSLSVELYKILFRASQSQDLKITTDFNLFAKKNLLSIKQIFTEVDMLRVTLEARDATIAEKDAMLIRLEKTIDCMKNSKIWRLSWPIRLLDEKVKALIKIFR